MRGNRKFFPKKSARVLISLFVTITYIKVLGKREKKKCERAKNIEKFAHKNTSAPVYNQEFLIFSKGILYNSTFRLLEIIQSEIALES
jgi:hypothetical protein